MKVLLVAEWVRIPGYEGAATHHTEFTNALAKQGVEAHILADVAKPRLGDVRLHKAPESGFRPFLSRKSMPIIRKICEEEGIDIIHKRMDPGTGYSLKVAKELGIPLLAEVNFNPFSFERRNSFYYDTVKPAMQYWLRHHWAKNVFEKADVVTCVSGSIKQTLRRHGIRNRIEVIPNGVDVQEFKSSKGVAMVKKKYGLRGPVVTMVGGLGPRHGLDLVIEIADEVPTQFMLIGGIERYADYVRKVKKTAPKNIIFTGKVDHEKLPPYLFASDICIAPFSESLNRHEPFGFCPVKILEYYGAGKSVVATDLPWIRELVGHDNGLLFREGDARDLSSAIRTLVENKKMREKMGRQNRELAEKKYSWQNIARQYIKIYKELL
jgi:glycosyltransferase involved in cell wall biosynthesis